MRWIRADHQVVHQLAGFTIKSREEVIEPHGLLDQVLVAISPHVVRVVQINLGKRDFHPRLPRRGIYRSRRSRLVFMASQFKLRVHPDFPDARRLRVEGLRLGVSLP
jgi:hypothetical protein